jgi:hypothetical protein
MVKSSLRPARRTGLEKQQFPGDSADEYASGPNLLAELPRI